MLTSHPGGETLELYLLCRIVDFRVAEVEEHLLLCEDCQSLCIRIEERIRATHPGGETLELYLLGRTGEYRVAEVKEHLRFCQGCRSLSIRIEESIRDIRAALQDFEQGA
jgi:predicted anti-sigma-YlaC factor YlaD